MNLAALMPGFPTLNWLLCPVFLVHDGARLSIPDGLVRFIARIEADIEETQSFRKQLTRLPEHVLNAWEWAKDRLRYSTTDHGLDFKPWKDGGKRLYSIRLSQQYRAHIEHEGGPAAGW